MSPRSVGKDLISSKSSLSILLDARKKEEEMSKILFFFQIGVAIETGSIILNYVLYHLQYSHPYSHYQDLFFGINIFTTFIFSAILLCTIFLTINKRKKLDKSTFLFLMLGLTLITAAQINTVVNDVLIGKHLYGTNQSFDRNTFNIINVNGFSSRVLFWAGVALILAHFIYKRTIKKQLTEKNGWLYPGMIFGAMMAFTSVTCFFMSSISLGMSPVNAIVSTNHSYFFLFL